MPKKKRPYKRALWRKKVNRHNHKVGVKGLVTQKILVALHLEEGNKKLNGVFLTEPIPTVFKTDQGNQIVEEIKKWFLSK